MLGCDGSHPKKVLFEGACLLGWPEILTVAHAISDVWALGLRIQIFWGAYAYDI